MDAIRRFLQWAIMPPQAYAVYLIALVLVFTLSFYAGTLKPTRTQAPPPAMAPSAPRG
ncbi:hypothetical protein [Bradyrhizobium lablabi]|uniref:hypothetical protein n=1 Tax=Bradyrhizobium lablabi TaxID=722472 RepID=UPI001BA706AE|nr:hypothetical protein [Bradyrhizobium lablabi]MBR0695906.1 hypothetical protein [Bradyrhizobium lablabi]